jgi:hypothetical protein
MSTRPERIYALFQNKLLVDEEVYWLGEPLHNHWHLKGRHLFYIALGFLLMLTILMGLLVVGLGLSIASALVSTMTLDSLVALAYILFLVYVTRLKKATLQHTSLEAHLETKKNFYWWKPSYYAITNHRVLIFEQGIIRDYWYFLLDTPLLKKPKYHAASIHLYSSTYAAKKKKTPVLDTLSGLPEEEAGEIFVILRQMREEAIEERSHKRGSV